jgi:hypothetical protein
MRCAVPQAEHGGIYPIKGLQPELTASAFLFAVDPSHAMLAKSAIFMASYSEALRLLACNCHSDS